MLPSRTLESSPHERLEIQRGRKHQHISPTAAGTCDGTLATSGYNSYADESIRVPQGSANEVCGANLVQ